MADERRDVHAWLEMLAGLEAPHGTMLVACALAVHAVPRLTCWPSYAALAAKTRLGRRALMKHVAWLEKAGALLVRPRRGAEGRQGTNEYELAWPTGPGCTAVHPSTAPGCTPVHPGQGAQLDAPGCTAEPSRVHGGALQGARPFTRKVQEEEEKEEKVSGATPRSAREKRPDLLTYRDPDGWRWSDFPHGHPDMACELHGALVPRLDPETGALFAGCPAFGETRCAARYDPRHARRALAREADADQERRGAAARARRFPYPGSTPEPKPVDPPTVGELLARSEASS